MEHVYSQYVPCGGAELFTVVCLPATGGRFPTVVYRRPYVDDEELLSDAEVCERKRQDFSAFLKAGERLRIDISSSAWPHYVPHTNQKGLFSEQTTAKVAKNTVVLDESYIELPIETAWKAE